MKKIPLLLVGCGGVGRQLLQHIVNSRPLHSNQGLALRVIGVCDSSSLLAVDDVRESELSDEFLVEICRAKSRGSPLSSLSGFGPCHLFMNSAASERVIEIAGTLGKSIGLAVVDCSASSETVKLLMQLVGLGCRIVLANKKPLTSSIEDYEKLVARVRYIRYESTVGAGLPIIASVTRVLASGDPITRIVGSLSGTLGYLMSELESGKSFSEVVLTAKHLGYTEPDPRDDLSGMDVARKALILARLLGWRINMDSVQVESLYPNEMDPHSMSMEDFIGGALSSLDEAIAKRVKAASARGNVLRYVCLIEESRTVGERGGFYYAKLLGADFYDQHITCDDDEYPCLFGGG